MLQAVPEMEDLMRWRVAQRKPNTIEEANAAFKEVGAELAKSLTDKFVELNKQQVVTQQKLVTHGIEPPGGSGPQPSPESFRDPKTGAPRPWRFLWLVLCLPLALLPLLVDNVLTSSWMALRMLRSPMAIDLSPGYAKSLDLASPEFSGQWWLLAPVLIACALSAYFGEELLFRGVLLPRMSGTFGRKGWFANATLFALYHAHVPLMLPFRWLAALVTVWPARRYRSNWLAVAVRGVVRRAELPRVPDVRTGRRLRPRRGWRHPGAPGCGRRVQHPAPS